MSPSPSPSHVADQTQNDLLSKCHRADFLEAASLVYKSSCPQLARHLISCTGPLSHSLHKSVRRSVQNIRSAVLTSKKRDSCLPTHCMHCQTLLGPGSCRIKLSPRTKDNQCIQQLMTRQKVQLTEKQRKKIERWKNSKNMLVICCSTCHKTTRLPCASRQDRPSPCSKQSSYTTASGIPSCQGPSSKKRKRSEGNASTPANSQSPPFKKHKRQSTSSHLSASSSTATPVKPSQIDVGSASSSGRKGRSAKKDRYRQLQKMLHAAREEQQASTESPLSRFLTSL